MTSHHLNPSFPKNKKDLVNRLVKHHSQPMVYEGFAETELRQFVKDRGIDERIKQKKDLVARLEKADRDRQFPFLELPAELRNRIYLLALVSNFILVPPTQPPLCNVCRQIRSECLAIFYHSNTFKLIAPDTTRPYESVVCNIRIASSPHLTQLNWLNALSISSQSSFRRFAFYRNRIIESPYGMASSYQAIDCLLLTLDTNAQTYFAKLSSGGLSDRKEAAFRRKLHPIEWKPETLKIENDNAVTQPIFERGLQKAINGGLTADAIASMAQEVGQYSLQEIARAQDDEW